MLHNLKFRQLCMQIIVFVCMISAAFVFSPAIVSAASNDTSYKELSVGSQGQEVVTMQTRLSALGIATTCDGSFGNATKASVIRYQQKAGFNADGIATNAVLTKLYSDEPMSLTVGSTGEAVKSLQARLSALGIATTCDGSFGNGTKASVIRYQQKAGFNADGIATNAVLTKLYSADAMSLTVGSTGEAVKSLQSRLNELGFTTSSEDVFGDKTKASLILYQQKAGLNADGIATKAVLAKLYSDEPMGLTVGSTGEVVKSLQTRLSALGIATTCDGSFGNGTKASVIRYQQKAGFNADGMATNAVLTKLYSDEPMSLTVGSTGEAVKSLQARLSALGIATTCDGSFGNGTKSSLIRYQQKAGFNADGIATNAVLTKLYSADAMSLTVGSTGEAVKSLQSRLNELGFTTSSEDVFGDKTKASLILYQQKAGLNADGIATNAVLAKLYSDEPMSLTVGSTGEVVKSMQTRLNELDIATSCDGSFGNATKASLIRYQEAAGFEANGIATTEILTKLYSTDPISTLTVGSAGQAVKSMQTKLSELGIATTCDGSFGNGTKSSLVWYQKAAGLTTDGTATSSLLVKLYSTDPISTLAVNCKGEVVRLLQTRLSELGIATTCDGSFGNGTKSSLVRYQQVAGFDTDGTAASALLVKLYSTDPISTLTVGSAGQAVRFMQIRLSELGIATSCDGSFGNATKASLIKFQQIVGFEANGIATSAVLFKLYQTTRSKGIDVSSHQGIIDWDAVKSSGVQFAILRCGYGDNYWKKMGDQDDTYFQRNVQECERLGIPWGTYLYCYAKNITGSESAESEYQHIMRLLQGKRPTLPVYIDMEEYTGGNYVAIADYICEKLTSSGYRAGVYANLNWWDNYLKDSRLDKYERWVAQYYSQCQYTGSYGIWQYTSHGSVSGISGNVDMDYCYKIY